MLRKEKRHHDDHDDQQQQAQNEDGDVRNCAYAAAAADWRNGLVVAPVVAAGLVVSAAVGRDRTAGSLTWVGGWMAASPASADGSLEVKGILGKK